MPSKAERTCYSSTSERRPGQQERAERRRNQRDQRDT